MTITPRDIRDSLRTYLLEAYAQEYDEAVETWKIVESKAQSTVTICGIFLAAAFAYSRELATVPDFGRWLLFIAVIALVLSVAVCVTAMRIQALVAPPLGTFAQPSVELLTSRTEELTEDLLSRFINDRAAEWNAALESIHRRNSGKASLVWAGQVILGVAVLPIAIFTFLRILQ